MNAQGIGQTLRVERERSRLSLEAIARATLVRKDYLELIDEDRLHLLPPGAYAKGFIRAYAQHLGLDPAPFVRGYEQMCEQPAPELSAVVRHPVRVPNAAQPRTWRIVAGGAVALLLLGFLGVFRSGEQPDPPLEVAADLQVAAASPAPNPFGAVVRVEIEGERSWVQAEVDGEVVFDGVLTRGDKQTFRGTDGVYLVLGNARSVRIFANGQDVGSPDDATYRGMFTPSTSELPPSVPQ